MKEKPTTPALSTNILQKWGWNALSQICKPGEKLSAVEMSFNKWWSLPFRETEMLCGSGPHTSLRKETHWRRRKDGLSLLSFLCFSCLKAAWSESQWQQWVGATHGWMDDGKVGDQWRTLHSDDPSGWWSHVLYFEGGHALVSNYVLETTIFEKEMQLMANKEQKEDHIKFSVQTTKGRKSQGQVREEKELKIQ